MNDCILRVGVMGCANIARRSMAPALIASGVGRPSVVASRTLANARECADTWGCEPVEGYGAMLEREDVDAVYMPLPTGLHDEWGPKVLEAGKHLLVEKSLASSLEGAVRIIDAARSSRRFVYENFMFPHHAQHAWVEEKILSGALGRIHLLRATFGFPPRPADDIRYQRALGGGSLLDAGAYVLKAAQLFLGGAVEVMAASLDYDAAKAVDLRGHAMLVNPEGQVAQVSFGFDQYYQCNYELQGSKGKLVAERAYTPPPGFNPTVVLEQQDLVRRFTLPADDHYVKLWRFFSCQLRKPERWEDHYGALLRQAELIEAVRIRNPWP